MTGSRAIIITGSYPEVVVFGLKIRQQQNFMEPAIAKFTAIPNGTPALVVADPYDLQRFVNAQDPVFEKVCAELRTGRISALWMPFIFPQLGDLDRSQPANRFAISSGEEAAAYLHHPVLGRRLRQCCLIVTVGAARTMHAISGHPDDLKFRSSMTLFAHATTVNQIFEDALRKYFGRGYDPLTLKQLSSLPVGKSLSA